ncbi:prepilin-type N-terminal cleavage/methylation domain-containing protein [Cytobacillus sp. Hz8]|uniref:type IV pilus modification PilV family protein n=1 Tax=Cytobacillus sp. Hz8 TaxID=3347168 RepID=UPI0035E0F610
MIMWKLLKKNHGLTLIEVLASLTILGIVMTSFLSFFNQAYSYTKKNQNNTVGINVARNVLNYFEQQNYDDITELYFSDSATEKKLTIDNCNDQLLSSDENVFEPEVCKQFFSTKINNIEYVTKSVKLTNGVNANNNENDSQNDSSLNEYLIGVEVEVQWGNRTETVRGLIKK